MGKALAIVGIWAAVGVCSVYAPKMVESVSIGAFMATLVVSFARFNN